MIEAGVLQRVRDPTKMSITRPVERTQVDGEAYFRIGLALGR